MRQEQGYGVVSHCPEFEWPVSGPLMVTRQLCDNCAFTYDPWNASHGVGRDGNTIHDSWVARLSERPHRLLTLRIPLCKLCQNPRFFRIPSGHGWYKIGIEGIELEINSVLAKWAWLVQGKEALEIRLRTGFNIKPCSTCINRETVLRGRVLHFVEQCNSLEAWAVWNWLSKRGAGEVDFWNHETNNHGLPSKEPPSKKNFQTLMADGWRARTGIEWVDIDDRSKVSFIPHEELFNRVCQWNNFAGIVGKPDPDIKLPPAPLDVDHVTFDYEPLLERASPRLIEAMPTSSTQHRCQYHHQQELTKEAPASKDTSQQTSLVSTQANSHHSGSEHNSMNDYSDTEWEGLEQDPDDLFGDNQLEVMETSNSDDSEPSIHQSNRSIGSSQSWSPTTLDHSAQGVDGNVLGSVENDDIGSSSVLGSNDEAGNSSSSSTLIKSTESNDTMPDSTLGPLDQCEHGWWHMRGMDDPNMMWCLPIGVELGEPSRSDPPPEVDLRDDVIKL
ncbi:hypothetical protein F4819DRAFT_487076 [Hypoxylon fuscum]|nr:hypothetical protein F4819DRAFT_487076 [Hypoxylon fuscum]